MKKFLSILGVSILSLSLFTGCGGATEEDVQAAAQKFMTSATTIAQEATKLDADAQAKLQEDMKALQTEATELMSIASAGDDADLDEALAKIEELDTKLKDIAKKNNIEVK